MLPQYLFPNPISFCCCLLLSQFFVHSCIIYQIAMRFLICTLPCARCSRYSREINACFFHSWNLQLIGGNRITNHPHQTAFIKYLESAVSVIFAAVLYFGVITSTLHIRKGAQIHLAVGSDFSLLWRVWSGIPALACRVFCHLLTTSPCLITMPLDSSMNFSSGTYVPVPPSFAFFCRYHVVTFPLSHFSVRISHRWDHFCTK